MNIVLIVLLAVNTLFLAYFVRQFIVSRRIFRDFITSPGENEASPFAELISTVSDVFSRSMAATAKATFMGKQSGDSRAEAAVEADIAEDLLAAKNPLLAAALQSFPTLKKSLRRNPQLVDIAVKKLLGQTAEGPVPGNGNGPVQFEFKA